MRARFLLIAGVAAVALAGAVTGYCLKGEKVEAKEERQPITRSFGQHLDLKVAPVLLNEDDPKVTSTGKLDFLYGWTLKADHWQFGGFSTLLINPSPRGDYRFLSLSDKGLWMQAFFDPTNKEAPFSEPVLIWQKPSAAISKLTSKPSDAESLVRAPLGYLVGFEGYNRIEYVSEAGGPSWVPERMKALDFSGVSDNDGIEAMTWTEDHKLIAFIEHGLDTAGTLKVFLIGPEKTDRLRFRPPLNYAPTDAATLPNGDILLLMRRFNQMDGIGAKVMRIKASDIAPGAVLEGEEVATFVPPLTVDNMEGLDVGTDKDGNTIVYLISDDNLNVLQRTIFMVFRLRED